MSFLYNYYQNSNLGFFDKRSRIEDTKFKSRKQNCQILSILIMLKFLKKLEKRKKTGLLHI